MTDTIKELFTLLVRWKQSRNAALYYLYDKYRIFPGPGYWSSNPLSVWWAIRKIRTDAVPFIFPEDDQQ